MNALFRISLFAVTTMFAASEASAATGDWPQYGFTAAGRRENTQETILTRETVPHLVQKWSANIPVGYSAPAVANGLVYIGSTDSHLYAFDARTGAPVWNAATGGVIQSSPAVADGVVYVGSYDGRVYAFDAETGAVRWATLTGTGQVWSSVTVAGGMVYAGTSNGVAVAINARTGAIKWTVAERGVLGTPAISHGVAYFPGGGWLTALDARTGTKIWQQSIDFLGFVGTPAASKGMVFVDTDKMFYAFDAKTGQERWQSSFAPSSGSSIAIANGHVHAGTLDQTLWNFDALTGKLNASKTGAAMDSTPALANGVLYIGSDEQTNTISAYNAANGKLLWWAPTAGWAQSPPTVANGMLYVGSRNQFTAYGLP